MASPYVPPEELRLLLAVLADEELTEEQERRLAEILRHDPRARTYYLDSVALLTSLQWEYTAATGFGEPGRTAPPPRSRRRIRSFLAAAVGLGSLAAGLFLALPLVRQTPTQVAATATERDEPIDDNVAILVQALGAEWEETSLPARPGASLPAGWLRLKSGVAEIQFYSGAAVILEGPADLQLISPLEAYCARGKLRATVPPQAHGFTIGSPKLELVDLGTEFGLRVDEGAKTEIHVFQGKVELYDAGSGRADSSRRELTTGCGFRVDESGAGNPIASDPSAFRTTQQLGNLVEEETRRRYRAWQTASERLRRDPRLLLYYTFQTDRPLNRTLVDRVQGRREPWNGVIIGCEWTRGRWPDKQALEFKRPGDCVRINVPGKYESVTLMTWVRLDSLENRYNGLLVTDQFGGGWLHWQIQKTQNLHLAMMPDTGKHDVFASPPIMGAAYFGQWIHLAAVYNCQARTATHYINGRLLSSHKIRFPHAIQFGSAAIGNWGAPRPGHPNPIRNLNGRMDEFLLFKEPLDAQEIHDLYQAGKLHS